MSDRLGSDREMSVRRREAKELLDGATSTGSIPFEQAYMAIDSTTLPEFKTLLELGHRARDRAASQPAESGKQYFVPILTEEDLRAHPEVFDFALDPRVIEPVTRYVGSLPLLRVMQVYWTPAQDAPPTGSQLWHSDRHDLDGLQVKFFTNLVDVAPDGGPFTFLPADVSDRVLAAETAEHKRFTDEQVARHAKSDEEIALVGPTGTGMIVDTNRCIHFGARTTTNERLVLLLQYVSADHDRKADHLDISAVAPSFGDSRRSLVFRHR